jgi:phenylacetate-CoA ligase
MADAVAERSLSVRPPRAIVTTSEMLLPTWRRRIEDVFQVPLFDEYGCNDGGVLSLSCAAGRYHLAENVSIVEVMDGGSVCPPGMEGDVVVTNLHSRVMPFLRYRVGDRAVRGEGPCPCGAPGATLERLVGRQADQLRLPGGRVLSSQALWSIFKSTPHVRSWQVVQPERDHVIVRLDVEPGFDAEEEERILRSYQEHCGAGVQVETKTDEAIERTTTAKHKLVVRLFE